MWIEKKPFGSCFELSSGSIRALVAPEMGMSLASFTIGGIQILDTSRLKDFLLTRKGLGPLILPHFNCEGFSPEDKIEELKEKFPHIEELEKIGVDHPFQHGLGRYVSWYAEESEDSITGFLTGDMQYMGYKLKTLAGFDFEARVSFRIAPDSLIVAFDVTGEKPIATGIHYYYDLVDRNSAEIELTERDGSTRKIKLDRPYDDTFHPGSRFGDYTNCSLKTRNYRLDTVFKVKGKPEEIFESLVIFSPEESGFICIEPLSYYPGKGPTKTQNSGVIMLRPTFPGYR